MTAEELHLPGGLVSVGGVSFVSTTPDLAVRYVIDCALDETRNAGVPVRFSNAYCVAAASGDPTYLHALNSPGITYPDGKPVAWAMRSRLIGQSPASMQIRGPSFFPAAAARGTDVGLRHYFFGGSTQTLELMKNELIRRYPTIQIVGSFSPEFSDSIDELVDQLPSHVGRSTVDVLWVALGTPKQDYVANELARRTGLVVLAVGAAFDFLAGTVAEAPDTVRRLGLEWAYRLCQEPRRLWRRYLIGNMVFVSALIRAQRRQKSRRTR